jgi:hypothetical protein
MESRAPDERGPIALAERILALLEEGRFTATYKYAVLLALIDLSLEKTSRDGSAPDMITTLELARKVVEIYWPHCTPYHGRAEGSVLRQSGGGRDSQAEIVARIARFRGKSAPDPSSPIGRARLAAPVAFERVVRFVEWKLIEMPLPRVQQFGHGYDPFLYQIHWDRQVRYAEVRRYQRGEPGDFDNRINLNPDVGEHLVLLNGLLRPLIHRQWAALVARMNGLEEAQLEAFLFGARRVSLDPVRAGLQELQGNRCFYCDDRLQARRAGGPQVDHFIPWARYPNNAIENLVVAHDRCNRQKRDFLAYHDHVARWRARLDTGTGLAADLADLATAARWESDDRRSLSVARGIYLHLPAHVPLWIRADQFGELDPDRLAALLS